MLMVREAPRAEPWKICAEKGDFCKRLQLR